MDEKITVTKEQKRISILLVIAVIALMITNVFVTIYNRKEYAPLVFVSIGLCCVTLVLTIIVSISTIKYYKKLNDKKRTVIWVFGLFVLCGLEIYMSASALSGFYERRSAEKSAVLFIQDKYGIEAEADYEKTFSSDVRKWTTVKMTADGKDFYVEQCTNNDNHTTIFADDYQLNEIKQAVFDEVSSVYPNGTLRDVRIYGSKLFFHEVIEKYFDGTNLDEVMECQHGAITVDFADTKFDLDNPLFERLGEWSIRPYFTSFDTAEHLEEFFEKNGSGIVSIRDKQYAKYAHNIIDRVEYEYGESGEKGKVIHKSYNIETNGELDCLYVQIEESDTDNFVKFFARYNESEKVSKPLSKAYARTYNSGSYNIYYPLEKLNGVSAENIGAAWLDNSTGVSNNRGVARASICGDYAVFALPYHADEFMIVDTTGTGGADKEI